MSAADGVAVVFVAGAVLYVVFGFADFGAGFWDLLAGGAEGGRAPRELIDTSISPVWEVDHVWLIFLLVVSWTAFGAAFASIMTTLFVPLALAALGIVVRGANFVFRKEARLANRRHLTGQLFGVASLLTPFFIGAAIGGLISGRVPPGNRAGNEITSWVNAPSILIGCLAVVIGAYLAAVYLSVEAHRRGQDVETAYFRRRAMIAGVVGLALGIAALVALRADERQMYDRFVDRSWWLLVLSIVFLGIVLLRLDRSHEFATRLAAGGSIATLVVAWGVAQYPYLLPFGMTIDQGAGSPTTAGWVLVWFGIAVVTVIPALATLYVLDQRGELVEIELGVDVEENDGTPAKPSVTRAGL